MPAYYKLVGLCLCLASGGAWCMQLTSPSSVSAAFDRGRLATRAGQQSEPSPECALGADEKNPSAKKKDAAVVQHACTNQCVRLKRSFYIPGNWHAICALPSSVSSISPTSVHDRHAHVTQDALSHTAGHQILKACIGHAFFERQSSVTSLSSALPGKASRPLLGIGIACSGPSLESEGGSWMCTWHTCGHKSQWPSLPAGIHTYHDSLNVWFRCLRGLQPWCLPELVGAEDNEVMSVSALLHVHICATQINLVHTRLEGSRSFLHISACKKAIDIIFTQPMCHTHAHAHAAVTLFANGLNALEAISPAALEAVEAAGTPGAGMVAHNARTDDVEHVNPATVGTIVTW
eukprot:662027-Pelagomonas_calceolata.AAC.5